jgi:hypothetical protein
MSDSDDVIKSVTGVDAPSNTVSAITLNPFKVAARWTVSNAPWKDEGGQYKAGYSDGSSAGSGLRKADNVRDALWKLGCEGVSRTDWGQSSWVSVSKSSVKEAGLESLFNGASKDR